MYSFQLSCESTIDLPYKEVSARDISVLFYAYMIDGVEYPDDMGRTENGLSDFYKRLSAGALPTTSQINEADYEAYFRPLLKKGDVLHIVFGSGMTASIDGARRAAERLRQEFPQRQLLVLDSTCSCCGYGLLVEAAADLRDAGKSMEETADFVEKNCHRIHHQFYSTDMKFFRRSGRVSGPMAAIATVLNICPIMRLNYDGRIIAYSKARGKKAAVKTTIAAMQQHIDGGRDYNGKCFISHSNCLQDAHEMRQAIMEAFPKISEARILDIGTIIASHCGPGTVAVFFWGDERPQ